MVGLIADLKILGTLDELKLGPSQVFVYIYIFYCKIIYNSFIKKMFFKIIYLIKTKMILYI